MEAHVFNTDSEHAGTRLDIFLSAQTGQSRTQIQKYIKDGAVLVNNIAPKKSGQFLSNRDKVSISSDISILSNHTVKEKKKLSMKKSGSKKNIQKQTAESPIPSAKPLSIIAETDEYLALDKPTGLLVHPTSAHEQDTLAGRIINAYPKIQKVGENPSRPGIVHRIDRNASGILVVAKTQKMFQHLKAQFKNRTIEKEYTVLVYGQVETEHGIIDFDIDRGKDGRMVSRPKIEFTLKNINKVQPGKTAVTEYRVVRKFPRYTLLSVHIQTGRMHQIRVHMLAFNHPVVGDTLYVNKKLIKKNDTTLGRLFLHAKTLCFNTLAGERVCFSAPLPDELASYLNELT